VDFMAAVAMVEDGGKASFLSSVFSSQ